jgi:hypothetical protein
MTDASPSPGEEAFTSLRPLNASWNVEAGRPVGSGWIAGDERMKTQLERQGRGAGHG